MSNKEKEVYLTKRRLVSAARKGFKKAAQETIAIMGYNVILEDGWIVKKFADGKVVRLKKMPVLKQKLVLD